MIVRHIAQALTLIAMACGSVAACASENTIRIDFEIDHFNGRLLNLSAPYEYQYLGPAAAPLWASSGYMLLTFDSSPYVEPLSPNTGWSFARATSGQLILDGVQGAGPSTDVNAIAYVNSVDYKSQADYGLAIEFTNNWIDSNGTTHRDLLQFDLTGYTFEKPTISSDLELALVSAKAVDNSNDHLRAYLNTYKTAGTFQEEHVYMANITAVTTIPEPSAFSLTALGYCFVSLLVLNRRSKLAKRSNAEA